MKPISQVRTELQALLDDSEDAKFGSRLAKICWYNEIRPAKSAFTLAFIHAGPILMVDGIGTYSDSRPTCALKPGPKMVAVLSESQDISGAGDYNTAVEMCECPVASAFPEQHQLWLERRTADQTYEAFNQQQERRQLYHEVVRAISRLSLEQLAALVLPSESTRSADDDGF